MATDLRTTQEYLNDKLGTVGLTKQQCLQRLFGGIGPASTNPMTGQDAANNYAGTDLRMNKGQALAFKAGCMGNVDLKGQQEAARRL